MMNDTIEQDIVSIIRATMRVPDAPMQSDTSLEGLGIESLDLVEMLFLIEDKFGLEVPYNANDPAGAFSFATVGDVVSAVRQLLARQDVPA